MARSIEVIQNEIKVKVRTYPALDVFLFPEDGGSKVSVFNLLIFTVAASIYTFEVMMDVLKADIQAIADAAPSGNAKWVQKQILNFQFGDVITLVDFVPTYVPVDEAARIVTRCSVKEAVEGITIKVAKGVAPSLAPLTAPELQALKDYYFGTSSTEGVGFAGVKAAFISSLPDRMKVVATVSFLGQYVEATVKTNVIAAIDNFFATFQNEAFDGTVFIIRLVDAIQQVAGVNRVSLTSVVARIESVPVASATVVDIQGFYVTGAGYLISEDTATHTLNDTITMIEETV